MERRERGRKVEDEGEGDVRGDMTAAGCGGGEEGTTWGMGGEAGGENRESGRKMGEERVADAPATAGLKRALGLLGLGASAGVWAAGASSADCEMPENRGSMPDMGGLYGEGAGAGGSGKEMPKGPGGDLGLLCTQKKMCLQLQTLLGLCCWGE